MTTESARLEIFLARLSFASDGDLSRGGTGRRVGKILDVFLGGFEILDFETEVVESRHEAAILHHVPRAERDGHFAVCHILAAIP